MMRNFAKNCDSIYLTFFPNPRLGRRLMEKEMQEGKAQILIDISNMSFLHRAGGGGGKD